MQTNSADPGCDGEIGLTGLSRVTLSRMALALLVIGLLWRIVRYLLQFPIWGDEAMLAENFAWFDYRQLTLRLENCQIAPILFLWGERWTLSWLGAGELSMRLLPFIAGTGSLLLFWRLTGLLLRPHARLFAIGFLAVAIWPVSMSTLLKPYAFDLLMSLVLLVPAAQWLRCPERLRWLIGLTLLAPVALLGSYTAAFVGGSISLALMRPAWKGGWRTRCWFAAYNLTLLLGFALAYTIGNNHLNSGALGISTRDGMASYWNDAFPPASPLAAVKWIVLQITGQMTAYPVGATNGGSSFTALCCIIGVAWWAHRKEWTWIILFGGPLMLNLIAALLHRYPFGGSCRISQHLAPGICLLAGLGLSVLLQQFNRSLVMRARWTVAIAALFALLGVGGLVRDVLHPYRDPDCAWMRSTMKTIRHEVPSADPVVITAAPENVECVFTWYWLNEGKRVTWNYQLPATAQSGERIWGFHWGDRADGSCQRLTEELRQHDPHWQLVKRIPYTYHPPKASDPPLRCELFCFERSPDRIADASSQSR